MAAESRGAGRHKECWLSSEIEIPRGAPPRIPGSQSPAQAREKGNDDGLVEQHHCGVDGYRPPRPGKAAVISRV